MSCGDQDYTKRVPKSIFAEAFDDDSIAPMLTGNEIAQGTVIQNLNTDRDFMEGNISAGNILQAAPNGNAEWVHMVPPITNSGEDVQRIFVNGKNYLMIDDSGPEELNPYKLQEQIVELRKELYEAISLIPGPVAEGGEYGACDGYVGLPILAEYASTPMYGTSVGTPAPEIDFGDNLVSIDGNNYEVIPASQEECKPVSKEESDYERAMNMIGK